MIPFVDLFAGCGGMTRGFVSTGAFQAVAAVEWDKYAAASYAANFGEHIYAGDIKDWLHRSIPAATVVIGGPPCQGFSALGLQNSRDPRNAMWRRYIETLERVQPAFFVLENVPQFLASGQFRSMMAMARPKGRLGRYQLEHYELNAADYGVPQVRKRAVVIGRLRGMRPVGPPDPAAARISVEEAWRDADVSPSVRDVDLPVSSVELAGNLVPGIFKMADIHLTRRTTELSNARFESIPEGGNRFDIPDDLLPTCWKKHRTGAGDVMGRLRRDRPSVTIRTEFQKPEKGRYLHPTEHRPITPYEAALLQGFPQETLWCGSKTSIARQIGNAVPPPLARAIALRIMDRIVTM